MVLFLEERTAGAGRVTPVRGFFRGKLPYFLEFWDETCREWTLDIFAGSVYSFLKFGHQGAELLSAKGEKMGVLAIFGGFSS